MPTLLIPVTIFIVILTFVVMSGVVSFESRTLLRLYQDIADQHSWRYEKRASRIPYSTVTPFSYSRTGITLPGPAIYGEYNLHKFMFGQVFEIPFPKYGKFLYTYITAVHKGVHGSAYISKKEFLRWLKKVFKMPDIEIRDPHFDSMFKINGNYTNISDVLDESIRQKFFNLISEYKLKNFWILEINERVVGFMAMGTIASKDFLLAIIDLVTSIANNIDKY